jgi:hypothetical protein
MKPRTDRDWPSTLAIALLLALALSLALLDPSCRRGVELGPRSIRVH